MKAFKGKKMIFNRYNKNEDGISQTDELRYLQDEGVTSKNNVLHVSPKLFTCKAVNGLHVKQINQRKEVA